MQRENERPHQNKGIYAELDALLGGDEPGRDYEYDNQEDDGEDQTTCYEAAPTHGTDREAQRQEERGQPVEINPHVAHLFGPRPTNGSGQRGQKQQEKTGAPRQERGDQREIEQHREKLFGPAPANGNGNGDGQKAHPLFARQPAPATLAVQGDAPNEMAPSPEGISGDVGGGEAYTLEEILVKTKPDSAAWEEWENKLFLLARWVKAVETLAGKEWDETQLEEQAFGPWYANHPHLDPGQDNRQDLWDAFREKHEKVTSPLWRQCLDRAWASAEGKPMPAVAMKFKRPEQRQLALWCQEIARFSADQTFFLSLRSVQSRFGLAHQQIARRRLAELENEDILYPVKRGSQERHGQATVYKYLPAIEGE